MLNSGLIDEGVVKYDCQWLQGEAIAEDIVQRLNPWRDRLYAQNLIGQYDNGIGFGNLSIRDPDNPNHIIITGTQTGHLNQLSAQHYTRVTAWDLPRNRLTCSGPVKASSESLTHASLYQALPEIQAIIHVHDYPLWECLMDVVPTTGRDVPYGTPEMALEMERLLRETEVRSRKILVMAGHEEGIISFGQDLAEAYDALNQIATSGAAPSAAT